MSRVSKIENTGNKQLQVDLKDGARISLDPGSTVRNVDVKNIAELKKQASVTEDLTEIKGSGGKQKINERRPV